MTDQSRIERTDETWNPIQGYTLPVKTQFLSIEPLLNDLGPFDLTGVHWIIVRGESGGEVQPMNTDRVTAIRNRCQLARVSFFFKQWGGTREEKTDHRLRGQTYDEVPPRVIRAVPNDDRRKALLLSFS